MLNHEMIKAFANAGLMATHADRPELGMKTERRDSSVLVVESEYSPGIMIRHAVDNGEDGRIIGETSDPALVVALVSAWRAVNA
jgi:hypothetical protein